MSLITKLEVQKNEETRANLYLDDSFYAGVSVELCVKHHLKKGLEIDKDLLDDIILQDQKDVAFNKALKYINSSLKTTKQIKDYLYKKEYSAPTVNFVIDKLLEYKYLDDEAYAKAFVLTYSNKYGKFKLKSMLMQKGVSQEIISNVLDGIEENSSIEAVANKYMKNRTFDEKTKTKLIRFLMSRGYDFDEVKSIVEKYKG